MARELQKDDATPSQPKEEFGRSNSKADTKGRPKVKQMTCEEAQKKDGTGGLGLPSRSLTCARVRQKIERTSFKELMGSFLLAES